MLLEAVYSPFRFRRPVLTMSFMRNLLACVLLAVPLLALAQPRLQPDLSGLNTLPLHTAPQALIDKALSRARSKSQPLQFAVTAPLIIGLKDGLWDQAAPGIARWCTRVSSAGARDLALGFSQFQLPPGASLWIYDDAGRLVQGPYTRADRNADGGLWTALIPGAVAVVELQVPEASRDQVRLTLAEVEHAFLDMSKADVNAPAKSGSCNVDVACSDGNNWRHEIRAVALITYRTSDGGILCSGQLLNNAHQDHSPLFITANHCAIDTASIASSVVFYWNYQTSTCGGTPDGSLSQNQSGASLLAGDVGTDFTLLRLDKTPDPAFDVYYAGWDAGGAVPQSGVAIHHPNGDEKRISTYDSPAVASTVCIEGTTADCTRSVQAWEVHWTHGTTEEGSSGGGLWNQNNRLVGVLSGGGASCDTPDNADYFGRFAAGFTANASKSGQLKAWLDPDSVGVTGVPGLDSTQTADPIVTAGGGGDGSSGGGGAMAPWSLLILAAASACRRRAQRPR